MQIEIRIGVECHKAIRNLPALFYNLLFRVQNDHGSPLFIPIRPLQLLLILDQGVCWFVDHDQYNEVVCSWRSFRSQERNDLREPVPYEWVAYRELDKLESYRIQQEAERGLLLWEKRNAPNTKPMGTIIYWPSHPV